MLQEIARGGRSCFRRYHRGMNDGRDSEPAPRSFPPVFDDEARFLVLGSMPGVRSLEARRYYAHPRNAFWPIMADVLGFDPALDYDERLRELRRHRIALWDVIETCRRPGSLDHRIEPGSIVANDFRSLFERCPRLFRVLFNGAAAEQSWRRHVQPGLDPPWSELERLRMPSTSPAHAAMPVAEKRRAWAAGLASP